MHDASRVHETITQLLARERMEEVARSWASANRRGPKVSAGRSVPRYSPAGSVPAAGVVGAFRVGLGRAAVALGRAIGGPEIA